MLNNIPIGQLRATIFVPPIVYDASNLGRIQSILDPEDGYIPNANIAKHQLPILQLPKDVQPLQAEWEMVSKKKKCVIHFGPQKIDIVKNSFVDRERTESEFCNYACNIFRSIVERFNMTPSRLAFAPTYVPRWTNEFTKSEFNSKIYNNKEFEGTQLTNLLFKQAYRLSEDINSKQVSLNYVAEASEGQNIIHDVKNNKLSILPMLNLALDVNTVMGCGYSFTVADLIDFFTNAPSFANKLLKHYID